MLTICDNLKDAKFVTHDSKFHADDVFSTIFLEKVFKDITLYRAKEINASLYPDKIIYDIGFGEFDHHQADSKVRENKVKYCSFGKLFEKYGKDYLKSLNVKDIDYAYDLFLHDFVMQIDAYDNGMFLPNPNDYKVSSLSEVVEYLNPTWCEEKSYNEAFYEAYQIFKVIFNRIEKRTLDYLKAKDMVEEKIEKSGNHLLLLNEYLPYSKAVLDSKNKKAEDIWFAIFPSNRGGYVIHTIPKEKNSFEFRCPLKEEWGGKEQEELEKLTGVLGFRFCHKNLFIASCDTLDGAIKIANLAMNQKR